MPRPGKARRRASYGLRLDVGKSTPRCGRRSALATSPDFGRMKVRGHSARNWRYRSHARAGRVAPPAVPRHHSSIVADDVVGCSAGGLPPEIAINFAGPWLRPTGSGRVPQQSDLVASSQWHESPVLRARKVFGTTALPRRFSVLRAALWKQDQARSVPAFDDQAIGQDRP